MSRVPYIMLQCCLCQDLHLHPLCYVIEVIQIEKGIFQSGNGAICIQQTTHVEFVTVSPVPWTRSAADQWQGLPLKVTGEHGGGGAGTRLRLICHGNRKKLIKIPHNTITLFIPERPQGIKAFSSVTKHLLLYFVYKPWCQMVSVVVALRVSNGKLWHAGVTSVQNERKHIPQL